MHFLSRCSYVFCIAASNLGSQAGLGGEDRGEDRGLTRAWPIVEFPVHSIDCGEEEPRP